MSDAEHWRAAMELMAAHGERAESEALRRADAALDSGDIDGFNRFKRVARLIVEMQARAPKGDVH